jgi:homopolymeric O-antigen transport system ATP-binding protein
LHCYLREDSGSSEKQNELLPILSNIMSNTIIQVENLGKKYLIKHQQQGSYTALRDVIADKVESLGKRIISPWNHKQSSIFSTTEEFWALKDISFKVKQGEVIGIIGHNGAGKSTLLKIISRITEPTKGRIRINGRVASLLEVGTGFHPELTGRENIFLNGAILGMGKVEIKRKFDEIVEFAEVEKFLDTPAKRYSSGMYVRLAFAVAAHLEPEILVVDEVLAVGDVRFQKKCLGKMEDVAKEGRTVLFVSHNMAAVESLCHRTILLENGDVSRDGESNSVINAYLQVSDMSLSDIDLSDLQRTGDFGEKIRFVKGYFLDSNGNKTNRYRVGGNIIIYLELISYGGSYDDLHINVGINTNQNILITMVTNRTNYGFISCHRNKKVTMKATIENLTLSPGTYDISVAVGRRGQPPFDILQNVLPFYVNDTVLGRQVIQHPNLPGFVQTSSNWTISEIDTD